MWWYRLWAVFLLISAALLFSNPVKAAEPCGTQTWDANDDAGKTSIDLWSTATDGCHVYRWNGTVGAEAGSGTVTFKVNKQAQAWDLSSPAGGQYCRYSKIHDANMAMAYRFGVPDGTEVTVSYRCS